MNTKGNMRQEYFLQIFQLIHRASVASHDSTTYIPYFLVPDDHARGLSTFTIMAGMGGSLGYALGAINWDVTALGKLKTK